MSIIIFVFLLFLLLPIDIVLSQQKLMLFPDNGFDQTEPAYLDENDDAEIEMEILDLLNLPKHQNENWTNVTHTQSAPNFLLKMYARLNPSEFYYEMEHDSRRRRSAEYPGEDKLVSPLDELELQESDNVMTLAAATNPLFQDVMFRDRHDNILWFNSSEVPCDVSLVMAQVKIYKRSLGGRKRFLNIVVYSINTTTDHSEIELNYVSSIHTPSTYEGWLQLNVTAALENWLRTPGSNKGLYIVASALEAQKRRRIHVNKAGLTTYKSDESTKPFMVGYFRNKNDLQFSRAKIEAVRRRKRRPAHASYRMKADTKAHSSCHRETFTVDFKKLNWLTWIVAPEKFDSFYCSGDCSFPLNNINTTNHAIIQTLAHLKNPHLPKPCCAPMALTSIVIIYHVSKDVVNMKKYNNMVVKSCGCL